MARSMLLWKSNRIDATKKQYYNENKKSPYNQGKKKWFITNHPSKRTKELINRIETIPKNTRWGY